MEAMGDGDRQPGVHKHVVWESADGEGAQGLGNFDLTTPRYDRARQMFSESLMIPWTLTNHFYHTGGGSRVVGICGTVGIVIFTLDVVACLPCW